MKNVLDAKKRCEAGDGMDACEFIGITGSDHTFSEESLVKLRDLNQQFGVLLVGKELKIIRETKNLTTNKMEIFFVSKTAFNAFFGDQYVAEQKKGRVVYVPLPKVWLNWDGKRVFTLRS
jgi:hypothetical protein